MPTPSNRSQGVRSESRGGEFVSVASLRGVKPRRLRETETAAALWVRAARPIRAVSHWDQTRSRAIVPRPRVKGVSNPWRPEPVPEI